MSSVCSNCGDGVTEPRKDWGYPCLIDGCLEEFKSRKKLDNHIGQIHPETLPYNDEEELDHLYNEIGLTLQEIADKMGCSVSTIYDKMKKFGIEIRSQSESIHLANPAHSTPASFYIKDDGYEAWNDFNHDNDTNNQVRVHQLLACLNNDPHEVFDPNNHVHHGSTEHPFLPETEHKLANWEGNLQVMTESEHGKYHSNQYWERQETKDQPQQKSAMDW